LLWKSKKFGILSWFYSVFCLSVSIVWLSFAAGCIVDFIEVKFFVNNFQYISITRGYDKALLSSTLLALGNTLADLFANGSLSSLGFAVMACTGTVAGQFFNLIFGLGINMLIVTYKYKGFFSFF
jgi:Ca2+/Na+ antiporter